MKQLVRLITISAALSALAACGDTTVNSDAGLPPDVVALSFVELEAQDSQSGEPVSLEIVDLEVAEITVSQ
ncbi:hypothetical protein GYB61_11035 [bacterium]|nr:hypothetical protein [bacterium]